MRRAKSRRATTSNEHDISRNTDQAHIPSYLNPAETSMHDHHSVQMTSRNLTAADRSRSNNMPRPHSSRSTRTKNTQNAPEPRPYTMSPSSLWRQLPAPFRFLILSAGFILFYYVMFAKHHHYDKEVLSFRTDLQTLIRNMNETGISDYKEVEVPAIFKNVPSPTPSPSPSIVISDPIEEKKPSKVSPSPAAEDQRDSNNEETVNQESSPVREQNKADESSTGGEQENGDISDSDEKSKTGENVAKSDKAVIEQNSTGSENVDDTSTETENDATEHSPSSKEDSESIHDKETAQEDTASPSPQRPSPSKSSLDADNSTDTAPLKASPHSEPSDIQSTHSSVDAEKNLQQPEHEVPVKLSEIPKGFTDSQKQLNRSTGDDNPLLVWNEQFLGNPSIKEQIFVLGALSDHVSYYNPLCLDTASGEAISFIGKRKCGGFNRSSEWLDNNCLSAKSSGEKEYNIKILSENVEKEWLNSRRGSIRWVKGLTILQILDRSCGNIAHYAGRALMLQHVMDNIAAYASTPNEIENVLVLPSHHIMKRFLFPHNYGYWHKGLFTALVSPAKYFVGSLGDFMEREKEQFEGLPRVQLLHNFSMEGTKSANKPFVCFRRAVIPGFLKGRFFVNDYEYPSEKPSLQSSMPEAPAIPRDSLRLRERVNSLLRKSPELSRMSKNIILLDRKDGRRSFEKEGRGAVISLLEEISAKSGYSFQTVTFDSKDFKEQYELVETASIAIGIHGANLVNTLFMPPLSVLIELFPYGFYHEMYKNGGNAGLKYFSYEMKTGKSFQGRNKFSSVKECIQKDQGCKVHYRDSKLQVTPGDKESIGNLLREAIKWCDDLHMH